MTRRDFNRLGAAALPGAALLTAAAGNFDYPWKVGVITDQVYFDLARVLRGFYPKYRLNWAEIRYLQVGGKRKYVYAQATPAQLKQVKRQLDDAGVRLSVLDTAIYKIALP